ncbi:GNAT family N-acetyltransferase [Nocardioides sp. cx-169]|uniref:GNAT family N-acetyltransferase n=1 Tax=Nocardioides sp. cx-169 TaxID=2899080 RepID=UPI001E3D5A52|nr:GNAT family N-acetyltransferase [Nocardioides sp. cx-169]MCD4534492.1 GNAT family N-acetyltransferase [Nocardioides sp. cx-169]
MSTSGEVSWLEVGALDEHAVAWDALVSRQPLASPFLRSFWLGWVTDPAASTFLLMLQDGELLGGVPLARDRLVGIDRYRFAGQGVLCPDHLDLVAAPGREPEVQRGLRQWFDRPGQRLLDLVGLAPDARLAAALPGAPQPVDLAPYQPLPEPGQDYLASRSSNFRRATRKADRRLGEAGYVHTRVAAADVPDALAALHRLHETRDGRGPLLELLPTLTGAFAEGVARGEARVDLLASPDEVVAVSLAFTADRRLSLYQVARSTNRAHGSAATVLLHRVIADAVEAGFTELDLLRGAEEYKSSYADQARPVLRLRVAHGVLAHGLVGLWALALSASHRLRLLRDRADASRRRNPS